MLASILPGAATRARFVGGRRAVRFLCRARRSRTAALLITMNNNAGVGLRGEFRLAPRGFARFARRFPPAQITMKNNENNNE
jgi:hypothetical protein